MSHFPEGTQGEKNFKLFKGMNKLICIKTIVFFMFWQGLLIGELVKLGFISYSDEFSVDEVVDAISGSLVSVEIMFIAIGHLYYFKKDDFEHLKSDDGEPQESFCHQMYLTFN